MEKIKPNILAVDDESAVLESFKAILEDDYNIITAASGEEALAKLKAEDINLVLLDIMMPGIDGLEALRRIKEIDNHIEVIMVTAVNTVRSAVQAMKLGAYDYIPKPFDITDVISSVEKALEKQKLNREVSYLRSELPPPVHFGDLVGNSVKMQEIYELVKEVGKNDSTILLSGESGTGKELIARAIHAHSLRADGPFVIVDCAAIPDNLLENELFGHEKGAFTDAGSQKLGKFELAQGGTIFLDELESLKLELQAKILRALEQREIQRVGGNRTIKIEVRIISATNTDLKKAVQEGNFREDLFYRLNVIPLVIPPLRERKDDIPLLVKHFLVLFNQEFGKSIQGLDPQVMELFTRYDWPGNVRELKNIMERLIALEKGEVISPRRLPLEMVLNSPEVLRNGGPLPALFQQACQEFEKEYIFGVLKKTNWNQTKAAEILGVHRNTLLYKMDKLGIQREG